MNGSTGEIQNQVKNVLLKQREKATNNKICDGNNYLTLTLDFALNFCLCEICSSDLDYCVTKIEFDGTNYLKWEVIVFRDIMIFGY